MVGANADLIVVTPLSSDRLGLHRMGEAGGNATMPFYLFDGAIGMVVSGVWDFLAGDLQFTLLFLGRGTSFEVPGSWILRYRGMEGSLE